MDRVDIKSYDHCGYAVDMDLILPNIFSGTTIISINCHD
jgi:hypothetical protein